MKVDEYGCLITEHDTDPDGARGDSCSETSRLWHIQYRLNLIGVNQSVNLSPFQTPYGFVRHPLSKWREDDFSSDQALPLFICYRIRPSPEQAFMFDVIKSNWFRTGNNNLVAPVLLGFLMNWLWFVNICVFVQALIFKLPYRWSDSTKWFEKTDDVSGDYLNFIHCAFYCSPWVREMIPKSVLKAKVWAYYLPEPNSHWLVELYYEFLERYWE